MHILIAAATEKEIAPAIKFLENTGFGIDGNRFHILITGVGLLATSFKLSDAIQQQAPDYIIQAGIAGSFNAELKPGKVVMISEEALGDCGVTEDGGFKDLFDLGLADPSAFPYSQKKLGNPYCDHWKKYGLPFMRAVSVNEITTQADRIGQLKKKWGAETESMEGAALHYICLQKKIPFIQLRSISNYVGERNKANWKLTESIAALNDSLIQIIQQGL